MNNTKNVSSAIFVIALVFGSWAAAGAQSEITLLAVGPMRVPTQKIVANFEAKTGHKVKVTYGNSVETRRMVAKGQALDVSLIIAPFPGAISSGAIVPGSAALVASILTAVGVPKGRPKPDISTGAAVKKALLAAKSIGYEDPEFATAGQGPAEAINRLGIADQIAAKSRVCANNTTYSRNSVCFDPAGTGGASSVRTTQKGLFSGDIDIGLLYLSDILPDQEKMTIVGVLPREIYTPTAIVGFISTHANDPVAARALLEYLVSPDAQAIFREAGFEPHK